MKILIELVGTPFNSRPTVRVEIEEEYRVVDSGDDDDNFKPDELAVVLDKATECAVALVAAVKA